MDQIGPNQNKWPK